MLSRKIRVFYFLSEEGNISSLIYYAKMNNHQQCYSDSSLLKSQLNLPEHPDVMQY